MNGAARHHCRGINSGVGGYSRICCARQNVDIAVDGYVSRIRNVYPGLLSAAILNRERKRAGRGATAPIKINSRQRRSDYRDVTLERKSTSGGGPGTAEVHGNVVRRRRRKNDGRVTVALNRIQTRLFEVTG